MNKKMKPRRIERSRRRETYTFALGMRGEGHSCRLIYTPLGHGFEASGKDGVGTTYRGHDWVGGRVAAAANSDMSGWSKRRSSRQVCFNFTITSKMYVSALSLQATADDFLSGEKDTRTLRVRGRSMGWLLSKLHDIRGMVS